MENQHRQIKGYRELNAQDIELMNGVKEWGEKLGFLIQALEAQGGLDRRWLAIGKTQLQQGIMALVRSIARPDSF